MDLLGNRYSIKKGIVHWGDKPMPKADAATFQHLGSDWGRDANNVYVQGSVKKIDAATCEYLNPLFVKDAKHVYDWKAPIAGADPKTFEVLDAGIFVDETISREVSARGFARDARAVYYQEEGFGKTSILKGADPKSFISLRNDYGLNDQGVWHQKTRLPKADPKTWVYLGRDWSMDAVRVFWINRPIPNINRETFTVVNAPTTYPYATDGKRFFMTDDEITAKEFWRDLAEEIEDFEKIFRVQSAMLGKPDIDD